MTQIIKGTSPITLINVFEVEPAQQAELVAVLNQATQEVMRHVPGFVSANIHRSLDGKKVVNYAQWQTKEHFERMQQAPGVREHMEKAAHLAKSFSPALYEVSETHESP